jgi:general secretion pathway protein I
VRRAGFTLLEVMIAMAILAVSLIVVMRVMDQAAIVTRYQDQQITAATLARFKMVDLEIQIEKDGFPSEDVKEECGNFMEDDLGEIVDQPNGLEGFEWCWTLKKVDLPIPMDMLGGDGEKKANGQGMQNSPLGGGLPGGLTPEAAAEQLGKAVRVLTLTVKWKTGEIPQELSVTTHLVNMTQAQVL